MRPGELASSRTRSPSAAAVVHEERRDALLRRARAPLWGTSQPWACVAIQTGQATNQVSKGLNTRILGNDKPTLVHLAEPLELLPGAPRRRPARRARLPDPLRHVQRHRHENGPITDFGTFYVTGWTGQGGGFNNPCEGNGDDPVPNDDAGVIVGHFIKYIDQLNTGGGSTTCDLSAFGTACSSHLTD